MNEYLCKSCGVTKPASEFYVKRGKGGKAGSSIWNRCKPCARAYWKARRAAHQKTGFKPNRAADVAMVPLPTAEQMAEWYRTGCRIA